MDLEEAVKDLEEEAMDWEVEVMDLGVEVMAVATHVKTGQHTHLPHLATSSTTLCICTRCRPSCQRLEDLVVEWSIRRT